MGPGGRSGWKWVVLALFLLAPFCLAQSPPAKPPAGDPDLLLLEVRLDQEILSEGLTAYQAGANVLLPLGELSRLLTLAIRTQPERGTASGYVLQEERSFYLDLTLGTVTHENRKEAVDPALVQVYPDDIYVASTLLARWLPVDLEVDFSGLALKVRAREPLPIQQRLERERLGAQARAPSLYGDPGYPRRVLPYRFWEMPSIDHTMGVDYRHADGGSQTIGRYATFLSGDLLWMESAMFLSGTDQDPQPDFRITLGRFDPDPHLLGPLRARAFAFGSVAVPGLANVARTSPTGNGLMLSNAPLTQPLSFGRHSLQGDLPPGWDVELYLNDALIGFQQSRSDGKYTFDDVPLVYGNNEFRLVFHGPQGQIRVERQGFLLEQSLVRPGEFYYRLAAHDDQDGNRRSIAQFDLGLGSNLSATGGVVTLPLLNEQRDYSNLGLRAQWRSLFVNSDMVWTEGGSLAELGLRTQVGALRAALIRAQLIDDYVSEEYLPSADPVLTRDKLRFDWPIRLHSRLHLPFTLETKRDHLRSGLNNVESGLRISGYFWKTSMTNQVRWQSIGGVEASDGSLQVSSRFGSLGVRGLAAYNLSGDKGFTTVSLAADKRLAEGYLLNADITGSLTSPAETSYGVGLTKSVGAFGLRISAGYSSSDVAVVSAQVFLSMAREPREPGWLFDALPQADSGAVSARVFLDRNLNGVMDEPDEPIKDAAFIVNGGRHPARTDTMGVAYLSRLAIREHADIGIDTTTLEDPQWSPREKGARLVPRPGKIAMLDFPVILTSEIDGTVYVFDEKAKRGIGDIVLELMDENYNVVGQATSASDGFYIVTAVPPGKYLLRIPRRQLELLGLTDTGTHMISVTPDGKFVNGIDFIVIPNWNNGRSQIQPPLLAPKVVEPLLPQFKLLQ